jgi:hypothetical protein
MEDDIDAAQMVEDDRLVADLRSIANEVDPVPDMVHAAARAAIATRHLDRGLAVLVADSAAEHGSDAGRDSRPPTVASEPEPAWPEPAWPELAFEPDLAFEPVRAGPTQASRLLSFASDGVQVDIEVSDHGDLLDLIGQFTGAAAEGCALEYGTGEHVLLEVDSLGRFLASGVRRGPVRTLCRSTAGVTVTTAWVTI